MDWGRHGQGGGGGRCETDEASTENELGAGSTGQDEDVESVEDEGRRAGRADK